MTSDDGDIEQITATELKKSLDAGREFVLLDVREPHELGICKLNYTLHIPLGEIRFHLDELEKLKDKEIVVYCRSGKRSLMAAEFLQEASFANVKNLKGGILAWSDEVDSSFTKY